MLNQISTVSSWNGEIVYDPLEIEFIRPPIYEVIRVVDGVPLFFVEHCERLYQSMTLLDMEVPFTTEAIYDVINKMVAETQIMNNNIRIEIGYDFEETLNWVAFWVKSIYPEAQVYAEGVKTVTYQAERENPHAKVFRRDFIQTIQHLRDETGAFEVILLKANGQVTEGSRSNLFFVKGDTLISASESDVLQGITRKKLIEAVNKLSVKLVERAIDQSEIESFDACFLTGTSIHVLPIQAMDGKHFESSQHPLVNKLKALFEHIVQDDLKHTRGGI